MRWSFPLSLKWPAFECTVPRVSRRSRAKSIFTCIIIFSMVGRWRKPNVLTVLYEEQIGQLTSQSCESGNVHLQTWIFALFTTPRGYIASFLAPSHSRYGTCTVNHNNTLVSAGRFLYSSFIVRLINCPFSHSHSWLAVFIVSPQVQEAVHGVTIEECQTALQNHNWNIEKAVHYLKVGTLLDK